MRARVLVNQGAGKDSAAVDKLAETFAKSGLEVEVIELTAGSDAAELACQAVADGCGTVIAGGGDGTIQAVAGALAGSPVKLGILPLGTLNHFARDLGLPQDIEGAIKIIAQGRTRRVDVARLGDHVFINTASIGYYPELIRRRASIRGRTRRALAGIVAGLEVIRHRKTMSVSLSHDGTERTIITPFIFIGNNNYRIHRFGFSGRARIDEGLLCVYVLRTSEIWPTVKVLMRVAFGRVTSEAAFEEILTDRCTISVTQSTVMVALDGELRRLPVPLEFATFRQALTVFVEEETEETS